MAAQFDQARTVIQPTQQTAPVQSDVFNYGAGALNQLNQVFGQVANVQATLGGYAMQDASQQIARSSQLYNQATNTVSVGFDRAISAWNQYAEQSALDDAAGIIQRDGNQQIIPPSTFYPPGLHTMAYAQAYRRAAITLYRESAANDYASYSAEMKAKYGTDLPGYQAAMREKSDLMLRDLSEDQRGYMELRFQGISGQASSQIAVAGQAAANEVNVQKYGETMTGITGDAVRMSGIFAGPGGNPGAAPGMIPNVLQGLPPSVQQRVSSTDRTPEKNAAVGGAPDSRHLKPNSAADIDIKGMPEADRHQLITSLMQNPHVRGLGFYGDHIHIDTDRSGRVTWGTPPDALKGAVDTWKALPAPGGGMSSTSVASDVARMRSWMASDDPNAVMLRSRILDASALGTRATIPQVKQDKLIEDMALKAVIAAKSDQIKSLIFKPGADNIIDPAQIAAEREKIRAYAATEPAFQPQIEQALNQALDYKIGQSNAMAQSSNLAAQRDGDGRIRAYQTRARQAELNPDPIAQAEAMWQLKQESLNTLLDRNLNDSQAMRISNAAFAASGAAKGALEDSNNKRVQGLVATMQSLDPTVSPQMKEAARVELSHVLHDPTISKDLTVSQRSYAQGAMNRVVEQQVGNDLVMATRAAQTGAWGKTEARAWVDRGLEEGWIGPHAPIKLDQALQLEAYANAKYDARQTQSRLAASGMDRASRGLAVSPEEREAILKERPFLLPEERVGDIDPFFGSKERGQPIRFDPDNQQHMQSYIDYKRLTGITPDIVKRAAEEMNRSPDQAKMQPLIDLYKVEYDLAGERLRKQNPGVRPTVKQLQDEVGHTLGSDQAKYLGLALRTNAEIAFKDWQAATSSTSVTAAQGQPNAPAAQAMSQAVDKLGAELQQTASGSTVLSKLMSGRIPFTDSWHSTPKENAVDQMLAKSPQVTAPTSLNQAIPVLAGKTYGKVTYDDDVKDMIVSMGLLEQTRQGKMSQRMLGDRDASEAAASQVQTNMFNDGLIEIVDDPNGKDGRVKFRTWQSTMGARLGVPNLSEKSAQDFANQLVYADARPTPGNPYGKMLPKFDPTQTRVFAVVEPDGSRRWEIGGVEVGTGQVHTLLTLDYNDPRISAATMAVQKANMVQLAGAWSKLDDKGQPIRPDAGSLLGWSLAVESFVSAPFQSYINRARTERSLGNDPAALGTMVEELDKNIQELERRTTGIGSAPHWRDTLRKMSESDTPLSGIPQDVLRAWAKANPAGKEPARLK